jgi:hypothetical protein
MSEPRLEDDVAMGYGEECESCAGVGKECICGEADTMEEARFEK